MQHVYPYAEPNAVTYMAPGQPFYDSLETFGGWFAAPAPAARPLEDVLVEAGLPREPPTGSEGTASAPWSLVEWSALGGALSLGAIVVLLMRRRSATTATP